MSDKSSGFVDNILDTETTIDENFKQLSERQLEDREDILFGSLPIILKKLEEKGAE